MFESLLEFFFRGVPESFLFALAVYILSKAKFDKGKYLVSSVILSGTAFITRMLPIAYGVNTILGVVALIVVASNVIKIDIVKSIRASITIVIILFLCEGINVSFIQYVLDKDLTVVFQDPISKTLYGLPSLLIFGCFILLYYLMLTRVKRLKKA
jgi:hypothetical protein